MDLIKQKFTNYINKLWGTELEDIGKTEMKVNTKSEIKTLRVKISLTRPKERQ